MTTPLRLDDLLAPEAPAQAGALSLDDLLAPEALPVAAPIRARPPAAPPPPQPSSIPTGGRAMPQLPGSVGAPGFANALESLRDKGAVVGDVAKNVAGALFKDVPLGAAHFVSTPLRAAFAPTTIEEARNPYHRAAQNRFGNKPDDGSELHAAIRRRAEGVQSPTEVIGETAKGLVTGGFDVQRSIMPGPTAGNMLYDALTGEQSSDELIEQDRDEIIAAMQPGARARGITNYLAFTGLLAEGGAGAKRTALRKAQAERVGKLGELHTAIEADAARPAPVAEPVRAADVAEADYTTPYGELPTDASRFTPEGVPLEEFPKTELNARVRPRPAPAEPVAEPAGGVLPETKPDLTDPQVAAATERLRARAVEGKPAVTLDEAMGKGAEPAAPIRPTETAEVPNAAAAEAAPRRPTVTQMPPVRPSPEPPPTRPGAPLATEKPAAATTTVGVGERGSTKLTPDEIEKTPEPNLPAHSQAIQNQLSVGESNRSFPGVRNLLERAYTWAVRRTRPIEKVATDISKQTGEVIPAHQDPGAAAMLSSGSGARAEAALENGQFRFTPEGNTEVIGPSLQSILAPLKGKLNALRRYEVAERTVELAKRNKPIETGIDVEAARQEIAAVDPAVAEAHKQMVQFRNNNKQYWADAGGLSPEASAALDAFNEHYVSLQRVFEGKDPVSGVGRPGRVAQQIRRLVGSKRRIVDTIESTVDQTRRIMAAADKQRIGLQMVELAEKFPEQTKGLIERDTSKPGGSLARDAQRIKAAADARGIELSPEAAAEFAQLSENALTAADDVIRVWRNGKLESWRVAPEIGHAMRSMSPAEHGLLVKAIGLPARGLKAGVTLNPIFPIWNFVRDTFDATLQSEYGFRLGIDSARGFVEAFRKGKHYREFRQGGADYASYSSRTRPSLQAEVRRLSPGTRVGHLARGIARNPVMGAVEVLKEWSRPFEQAARLGEFMRAREQGASVIDASLAAAKVTTDFRQSGSGAGVKALSHMTSFLNPAVQSLDVAFRTARKHPARLAALGVATVTLPSIYLWAAARGDQEIQDLRKSRQGLIFWFTRLPGGKIVRVPKPFLWGQLFGTSIEAALDKAFDNDEDAGDRLASGLLDQATSNVMPNAIQGYFALKNNRDPFFDTPIVPHDLTGVDPEYQVQPYTGATARGVGKVSAAVGRSVSEKLAPVFGRVGQKLGDALQVSPAMAEYAWRSLTGTLGAEGLRMADRLADRIANREPPAPLAADAPVFGRLLARTPSLSVEPVQMFYRDAARSDQVMKTIHYLTEHEPEKVAGYIERHLREVTLAAMYEPTAQQLGSLRGVLELMRGNKTGLSRQERRAQIDEVTRMMVELTRTINTAARSIPPSAFGTEAGTAR